MSVVTGYNDQILSYNNIGSSQKNPPLMLSLTPLVKLLSLLISNCQRTIIGHGCASLAWHMLELAMMIIKFPLHPFYGTFIQK